MASATSGSFAVSLAAGSSSADKYTMTLSYSYSTSAANNKTTLTIKGVIKSNNSSYTSYKSSSTNTVQVRYNNSSGTSVLSNSPTTAYDCRNLGSTQIFSYSVDIPHDSSGNRTVWVSWYFNGNQSTWNPTGTVTGTIVFPQLQYTISYNANGGSGAPSSQTKTAGTSITLSSTTPTRTGYVFSHWNTNSSGSGTSYLPSATYSNDANLTLYAIWNEEEVNLYIISYNANGGLGAPKNITCKEGSTATLSKYKPIRSGYTFLGWAKTASATSATYQPQASISSVSASITLYAVWEKNSVQSVYVFSDGKCFFNEFIEDDSTLAVASSLMATNLIEGSPVMLTDDEGTYLSDENDSVLFSVE